jgi:putative membrane fusion protein
MDSNIYYIKGKYENKNHKFARKHWIMFIIFLAILILFALYLLFFKHIEVSLARYGQVVDGFITDVLIIREEEIVSTPVSGNVFLKKKEGDRVSSGEEIIEINNNGNRVILYNQHAGLISYASDGLENYLSYDKINELDINNFKSIKRDYKQLVNGYFLAKGQNAYRIISNFELYIVFKTNVDEAKRYNIDELVFIRPIKFINTIEKGNINRILLKGNEAYIVVELNHFIKEWLNMRWIEIEFIKNIYRGIVIPRLAIFTQKEGEGVLVYSSDKEYQFKKVKILGGNKEKVVVNGLEIGDRVVVKPEKINFGR